LGLYDVKDLVQNAFAPNAVIELEACYSAYGSTSIATVFKQVLPNARVWGFPGTTRKIPAVWETFKKKYCKYVNRDSPLFTV
jgi:hypothetical protein